MRALFVACVTMAATIATPASAQAGNYSVDAFDTDNITLTLCNPDVRIEVHGDGDTDLDFTITGPTGTVLHSDTDETDWTVATIHNGDRTCRKYTLKVENYGDVYNRYSVEMSNVSASSAGSNDGLDRHVQVRNRTGESIYFLYWSNTGDDSWRQDRLGEEVLLQDQEWSVVIDDGSGACRFDFKAVTASDREIIRNNVDVCTVSTIDFK